MRRIRIGKDIEIRWKIFTNGEAVSLLGRDLKLVLHHSMMPEQELDFTIDDEEDSILVSHFRGRDQKMTGIYRLTLWENFGINGQTVLDYCSAFELVGTTCEEDGGSVGLDSAVVEITGNMIVGVPGLDGLTAYELFKKYNPESELTEEEYAEAPVEAANAANEAAKAANDTNDKIAQAETLRVEAENARASAEKLRDQAESGRKESEEARKQAETVRIEAENQRKSAEDIRNSNETSRVNAEATRTSNEEARVTAESSRVAAETKRATQEKWRQDTEAVRVSNEKGRVSAEEQRVIAENERVSAEEERERSVEKALTYMSTAIGNATTATVAANNAAESAQHVVDTYDDVINTLAHSDCTLDERVEALERALISVLSGAVVIPKLQVNELGVWGDNNLAFVGDGAPTKAPDRAGQFYIDKTARALYFSTGNAAVSDWKIQ